MLKPSSIWESLNSKGKISLQKDREEVIEKENFGKVVITRTEIQEPVAEEM